MAVSAEVLIAQPKTKRISKATKKATASCDAESAGPPKKRSKSQGESGNSSAKTTKDAALKAAQTAMSEAIIA